MQWINGYIKIKISKDNQERFINLCKNKKIVVKNIRTNCDCLTFYIKPGSYFALKRIAKKTGNIPVIIDKSGLPFIIQRFYRRKGIVLGMMFCIFILYISSLFLWEIKVYGNSSYSSLTLKRFLRQNGIYEGMLIKNINAGRVEKDIRRYYNDIGWVSCEKRGTVFIVRITENTESKSKESEINKSIYAPFSGEITKILVREGTPLVKTGDNVKKSDMLVSDRIEYLLEDGISYAGYDVNTDADICIRHSVLYNDELDLSYKKKCYSGKKKYKLDIVTNSYSINIIKPLKEFDMCGIIITTDKINPFKDFVLPISIYVGTFYEYKEDGCLYSKSEAKDILYNRFNNYRSKLEENGSEIIKKKLLIDFDSNKAVLSGELIINEVVGNHN